MSLQEAGFPMYHPGNTIIVSKNFKGYQKRQYETYDDIRQAAIDGTDCKHIIVYPGLYTQTHAIPLTTYRGHPGYPDAKSFIFCYPGVIIENRVEYDTSIGDWGCIVMTGSGGWRRFLGHAEIRGLGNVPCVFVHAGASGTGDQIIEFDSIQQYSEASSILLEDANIILKGRKLISHAPASDANVLLWITNSEIPNRAVIEIDMIQSNEIAIGTSAGSGNTTIFKNCYIEKKADGGACPLTADPTIAGQALVHFQNCLLVNKVSNAAAHGLDATGTSTNFRLMNTGIKTTHASSKSVVGDTALGSIGSIANKALDGTTTELYGSLTIDANFTVDY